MVRGWSVGCIRHSVTDFSAYRFETKSYVDTKIAMWNTPSVHTMKLNKKKRHFTKRINAIGWTACGGNLSWELEGSSRPTAA